MFNLFKAAKPLPKRPVKERRAGLRRPVVASAKIRDSNGNWHTCVTADISPSGARLTVGTRVMMLPRQFEVWLSGGSIRRVRLAWRSKTALGVRFL